MRALVCEAGGRRFWLDAIRVREIHAAGALTPVPTAPPEVRGVTQVRGQILPVLDLGAALGVAPPAPAPASRLVDVEAAGVRVLLDAGEALDLVDVDPAQAADSALDLEALISACARRVGAPASASPP